ncbi:glycosyltransferase family 2 protein [Echinicola salinicaeni]|uniref:glycosyltransferase family 2 protein n=1 Tax=Echinicola salinicaeni TaxID=2762757 RepID=UPI001645613C|nr:glycosyltransferase family 2 protein [Echinicola salinicaeni]
MEERTSQVLSNSIAIILLNWNGYAYTRQCLYSLQRVKNQDFQVILVDNASTDGSVDKLKEEFDFPKFICNSENLGFTGGNNVGINYALEGGYAYIMLLNNDTEVDPDFLDPLLNIMEANVTIGAVQPLMYYLHDQSHIWNAGAVWNPWTGSSITNTSKPKGEESYKTDWITGCCMLIRSNVIREVGKLNEHYFAYYEDVDWSLRMEKAGYEMWVVPKSVIYHEAGASSKSKSKGKEGRLNPKVHYLNARNQLFQLRNHLGFPYLLTAWPFQFGKMGIYGLYFLLRGRKQKFLAMLMGIKDGIIQDCK